MNYPTINVISLFTFVLYFATPNLFAQTIETGNKEFISIDIPQLQQQISSAPATAAQSNTNPLIVDIPMPGNCTEPFEIVESPIMDTDLAAQYPFIKTYAIAGLASSNTYGRLTISHLGLHAHILSPKGTIGITPVQHASNKTAHQISSAEEVLLEKTCGMMAELSDKEWEAHLLRQEELAALKSFAFPSGNELRTYRLATIVTGEFYEANKDNGNGSANDDADVITVLTAVVSGVQVFYDRDLAVRFTLLTPVLYNNYPTDPFQPDGEVGAPSRTTQAATQIGISFPTATYDIGHVFHNTDIPPVNDWSGGGVAGLGVVCSTNGGTAPSKARGWSGSFNNQSTGFISLTAHEFGHMFDADHTFNGIGGTEETCTNNISATSAYEIASGITIMSYNGLCGAGQNIPSGGVADEYFHTHSLTQMINYINTEATCVAEIPNGNTPPTVNANSCGGTYAIPVSTPFELNGTGSDANGNAITYTWEQYNEDGAGTPTQGFIGATAAANTVCPNFRNYPPSSSPSRTIPRLSDLVSGVVSPFETLPTVNRTLNFRLTARDNNPAGGGVACSALAIQVSNVGGPFTVNDVTGPWAAGSSEAVSWNVAGTTVAPINCATVNILLSIDGGLSYPYTLVSATANDGTETVSIPAGVPNVSTARIRVESATSTCVKFFDITNQNFVITSNCLVGTSIICPTTPIAIPQGEAGLDLTQTFAYGTTTNVESFNVLAGDPTTIVATYNVGATACRTWGFSKPYGSFSFYVETGGSYSFSEVITGYLVINMHNGTFNPASPCTNFLSSNSTDTGAGSVTGPSTLSVTLQPCIQYTFTLHGFGSVNTFNGNVNISGPGEVYKVNPAPGANYSYTYAAVNLDDNLIDVVSPDANFTSLLAGSYAVYGISYKASGGGTPADVDPSTFVGQSIAGILNGGNCALASNNSRSLIVEVPLPVELVSFTGKIVGNSNLLQWTTASEENTAVHIIERSADSRTNWSTIGQVRAAGTSASLLHYELEDKNPLAQSYYRLRSVDFDQSEDISNIIFLERESDKFNILHIHPIPTFDGVTVEFEQPTAKPVEVQVTDLLGRVIHYNNIYPVEGVNTYQIDLSQAAAGVYFLTMNNGLESVSRRLVKR